MVLYVFSALWQFSYIFIMYIGGLSQSPLNLTIVIYISIARYITILLHYAMLF